MGLEKERIAKVQREKELQIQERKRVQELLEKEKEIILKDFEKKKKKLIEGQNIDKSEIEALLDINMTARNSRH